ncbi:MAG: hypothetical protein EZS28_027728, partial [Streblomastix strix]
SINFQLSQLSFTNCKASGAGNNLHIRSPNTYNTGIAIAANSLVTVKDLSDLYTNEQYSNDYMGIDESKVNDGNTQISDHQALFLAAQQEFIIKEYYIRSIDSSDENDCSQLNPCKIINNILSQSLPTGFVKGLSITIINLLSETSDQTNIIISSETELNNIITIQSDGYQSGGTQYTKQSILTSLFDTTLFTISNTGRLKLFGLHFDNLNPSSTATNPLIQISQSYDRLNPQVMIKDCIFEQFNLQSNSLYHSLIITSGGTLLIENTLIQNYEFINGQRVIDLGSSDQYLVDIVNSEFKNINQDTSNQQGGAIISGSLGYGALLRIRNQCKFTNITSTGQGGAISCTGDYITIEINRVSFIKCKGLSGSAIFATSEEGSSLTIENQSEFKQCEIIGSDENQGGGAIYLMTEGMRFNIFYIRNSIFEECKSNNLEGGAILMKILSPDSICNIDGVQFINCQGSSGGAINYLSQYSQITINGSSSFTSCSSLSNPGGAIHSILILGEILIESAQFELCSSNSDGGSVFAQIYYGGLIINQVTYVGSSCIQPGSGGAIAIVQQNSYSRISITESSFTNCQTLPGSSNQYGWGGAIYIFTQIPATDLSSTNFQLSQLSFTNCIAFGAGNNLHIRSPNTYNTGIAIAANSLLTVKDMSNLPNIISDLFTNEQYYYDYMGIDDSKVNNGNTPFSDHQLLFYNPELINQFQTPYYVNANYGKDHIICGNNSFQCNTIKFILNIDKISIDDYPSNPATINIELQTNTQLENGIMINSNTPIGNDFQIQSSEYTPEGTDYIKRQIQTSSKTQSLFTISNTGRLKLFGLHFDNLNPTSNTPLISISTDSDDVPQLQIEDCEFKQDPDSYSTLSLSHSIISINGGIMKIEKAMIESYKLMNEKSIITIKSDLASSVTISGTSFISIKQSGIGDGAVINAQLNGESKLTIKDGSLFTECQSFGSGGAIYAILKNVTNGGIFIEGTTKTAFGSCAASDKGGAIYLDIGIGSEDKFQFDGASYQNDNDGLYGKSLFINAQGSLRNAVPVNQGSKLGTLSDSTEILQPEQIMGYDNYIESLAIPLIYVYTSIAQEIYHVQNSDSNPNGNDNRFCGHFNWPCLTIGYGIAQSETASAPYQIGIISEYKLNKQLILGISEQTIKIQNQLSNDGEISSDNSILLIEDQGKLSITSGTIQLDKITFSINESTTAGYVIEGITESANINIKDCQMRMTSDSKDYSISRGLIELSIGNLIVNNLEVKDIIISDRSVIKVNEAVAQVSVMNCSLKNISKIGENNGGIIELSKNIDTSNEEQKMNVRIETSSFVQPISTSSSNLETYSPFIHASIGKL